MTDFTIHSTDTAKAASVPVLEKLQKHIGFIPGLYGVLAEAPTAIEAYDALSVLFKSTSLTTAQQHVVLLTINYQNNCGYCMPAHTALAKLDRVPDDVIEALRNGVAIADPTLQALRTFTSSLVENRGWVPEGEVRAFLDAGYTRQHILEVIVGMAYKVISNYTNHIADTPVDAAFKKFAWDKSGAVAAA